MTVKNTGLWLALSLLWACQSSNQTTQNDDQPKVDQFVELEKIWETDTVLHTPESVIYDPFRNRLYVSNIGNVPPTEMDLDGYISVLSLDGQVLVKNWVGGLSAPKGMGIVDSSLFVTNINEVVEIDLPSGQVLKSYPVDSALFLNDITIGRDNEVYISDSYTNKIHVIFNGELSLWKSDTTMGNPNGLLFQDDKLMMASFGSGQFFEIDLKTKGIKVLSDSLGGGDGVVAVENGYIVSDWNGRIFNILPDGTKSKILDTSSKKQTADIWFDQSANVLYVATFFGNTVTAYSVN